jgi:hypothetical protein
MADAGIAQINQLSKDDIVIALMGITGSGYAQTAGILHVCDVVLTLVLLQKEHTYQPAL